MGNIQIELGLLVLCGTVALLCKKGLSMIQATTLESPDNFSQAKSYLCMVVAQMFVATATLGYIWAYWEHLNLYGRSPIAVVMGITLMLCGKNYTQAMRLYKIHKAIKNLT